MTPFPPYARIHKKFHFQDFTLPDISVIMTIFSEIGG